MVRPLGPGGVRPRNCQDALCLARPQYLTAVPGKRETGDGTSPKPGREERPLLPVVAGCGGGFLHPRLRTPFRS
jgi:hypothetical protein